MHTYTTQHAFDGENERLYDELALHAASS